ncbi:MAG: hypothetical protein K2X87_09190 [Gemmataceae bacterium]|nr:hypothetical protein [Gemmataceae bacterium]
MDARALSLSQIDAGLIVSPGLDLGSVPAPRFIYHVECLGPDGRPRWTEDFENLVTTAGRTDLVDKYLKGSAYTAAWFCGLKGTGSPAASDTLASTGAWSIVTPYSGNRPSITWGTTSSGSNTSSAVSFSINATATVAGAFVCSVASGTSGTLYSAGDFSASRSVASGDTLNVTLTISIT